MTKRHFQNPVIFMSRATTREMWLMVFGSEPDLYAGTLLLGRLEVRLDDRMDLGEARIEEDPDRVPVTLISDMNDVKMVIDTNIDPEGRWHGRDF